VTRAVRSNTLYYQYAYSGPALTANWADIVATGALA
jgi:hypothetical protein